MKKKIALNLKETRDSDLAMLGNLVAQRMTGNELFPDPGMMIIELQETASQFRAALAGAMSRDMEKVAYKNNIRALLIRKLKEVGDFVITESKGDKLALVSSGFDMEKVTNEIILKAPTNFKITPGPNPGEIIMQVSRVKGARSYIYQWTPYPATAESVWQSVIDTRCKRTITGLPLGVNYEFRMAAIGARNQMQYTKTLSRYIS